MSDDANAPTAGPVAGDDSPANSPENPSPTPPAEEALEKDFDALLADVQRERDEYLELAQRTKADFENYRKRMSAEVEAAGVRGKGAVIRDVLPVLDDLERALAAAEIEPAAEATPEEPLAQGVLLVFRSLRDTLSRYGIEALDPKGEKFDPQWHEALSTLPGDGAEPGVVLEVLQKGYRLEEQLIRPARVVVSE